MGASEALSAQLSESIKLASEGREAEAASLSVAALEQALEIAQHHDGGSLAECTLLIIWEHLGAHGYAQDALLDSIQMDVLPQILALAVKSEESSKLCCMLVSRVVSSCTPREVVMTMLEVISTHTSSCFEEGRTSCIFSLLLHFLQLLPGLLSRVTRRQRECAATCLTPVANLATAVAGHLAAAMEAVGINSVVQADALSPGFNSKLSNPVTTSGLKISEQEEHLVALLLSYLAPFVHFTRDVKEMCTACAKESEAQAAPAGAAASRDEAAFTCFCLHLLSCLALQTPENVLLSLELSSTLKQAMEVLQEVLACVEGPPHLVDIAEGSGPLVMMHKMWDIALAATREMSELPTHKILAGASIATFALLARADDAVCTTPRLSPADANASDAMRIDILSLTSDMATALFSQGAASSSPQAIQKAVTLLDMAGAWAASCAQPASAGTAISETQVDADGVKLACLLFSSAAAYRAMGCTPPAAEQAEEEEAEAEAKEKEEEGDGKGMMERESDAALQLVNQLAAHPGLLVLDREELAAVDKISHVLQAVGSHIATCATDHQRGVAFKSVRSVLSGLPPTARLCAMEQVVAHCPSHDFVSLLLQVLQQQVLRVGQRPGTLQHATFVSPATLKLVLKVLRGGLDDPGGQSLDEARGESVESSRAPPAAPSPAQSSSCAQECGAEKGPMKKAADLFDGRMSMTEDELVARADALAAALNLLHVVRMLATRGIAASSSKTSQADSGGAGSGGAECGLLPPSLAVLTLLEHGNSDALTYAYVHAICKAAVEKLHAEVEGLVLRDRVLAVGVQLPVAHGPSTVGGAPQASEATQVALTSSSRLAGVPSPIPSSEQQAGPQATRGNDGLKQEVVMRHIALARLEEACERLVAAT